jgi:peptidoglycan/LPS O-acetylase OafA/YrhL
MIIENIWVVVIFILIFWLYYERIMYAEEQYLRNKFGDEYRSWSEITPAFIPNLGLWQGTNIKFSIKKVLKKEKNGLAAIFIVFYIFNIINNIINQQNIFFHNLWLFVLCLFGIFNYLIFTYLKRRTHVLDEEGR